MPGFAHLRRVIFFRPVLYDFFRRSARSIFFSGNVIRSNYATNAPCLHEDRNNSGETRGKWYTLPPYTPTISGASLGKAIAGTNSGKAANETTAFKWILHCCPEIPRNLVHKLFRLRQVRRESFEVEKIGVKRVSAKDLMHLGDRILLPNSVLTLPAEPSKTHHHYNEEEVNFIRSLELYKDGAIIVINKPPGLPVQGGIGIKLSLDELAASCLCYDYSEPPKLVHRLDRDSSGILVMGRTQTSTTLLHSIFREKTIAASNDDIENQRRILQRKYWALVLGSPRRRQGLISAPLGKVVVDNGKSDRITAVGNANNPSCQHAVTQYRVIESSHGYTWLELSPITGRKHQLRVHCAEVLGTPIVGDYKYGRQAHKTWEPFNSPEKLLHYERVLPFGIDLKSGSISTKIPRLHLHCKQMVLPDVSRSLRDPQMSPDYDFAGMKSIELDAPLPHYMQKSWELLSS